MKKSRKKSTKRKIKINRVTAVELNPATGDEVCEALLGCFGLLV